MRRWPTNLRRILQHWAGSVVTAVPLTAGGTPSLEKVAARWPAADAAGSPDLAFIAADTETAAEAIKTLRDAGFKGAILGGPELGSPLADEITGGVSTGVVFVSQVPLLPEDPKFVEGYEALSGGPAPGAVGAWAYATAVRMLDGMDAAIRSTGRADRGAVQAALEGSPAGEATVTAYVIMGGEPFFPYVPGTP